jgi:hypothetical protein
MERYMAALETADRQEGELAQAKSVRLQEKIAALREQMAAFKALEPVAHAAPDQQVSLTDPDARSMATSGRGNAMQERLDRRPDAMRIRRATVEHAFGTLKAWMGVTHFKTRPLDKVRTEAVVQKATICWNIWVLWVSSLLSPLIGPLWP